jgi:hypothetical protein
MCEVVHIGKRFFSTRIDKGPVAAETLLGLAITTCIRCAITLRRKSRPENGLNLSQNAFLISTRLSRVIGLTAAVSLGLLCMSPSWADPARAMSTGPFLENSAP